jgi:hypothetical protein
VYSSQGRIAFPLRRSGAASTRISTEITLTDAELIVCAKQLRNLARLKVAGGRPTAFVACPTPPVAARVLFAQTSLVSAALEGTVSDSSGGRITAVKVTVRELETHQSREVSTNGEGTLPVTTVRSYGTQDLT